MTFSPSSLLKPVLLLTILGVLSACGGGSGTTANPNLNTDESTYTGPAARTEEPRGASSSARPRIGILKRFMRRSPGEPE